MNASPDAGALARLRATVLARLTLIPNWRATLKHAWSIRLDALLIVLGAAEFGVDALSGNPPIDPMRFVLLGMAIKTTSAFARLIQQRTVSGDDA